MVYKIPYSRKIFDHAFRFDPYGGYNFLVEISGLIVGGFTSVSGLEGQIITEDYIEGGCNTGAHTFPTRSSYSNLVLKKGVTDLDSLWNWYDDAANGRVKQRNGTIILLDQQMIPATWWTFKNAYPVKWNGPAFDAMTSSVLIESLELVHGGLEKSWRAKTASVTRLAANRAGWTGF